ncbi:DAD family protein [Metarhizium acridum CQMa 102]|uniref:DAD family protein n=1 Tax=Metarhizium acridum (strain CQMa 102) TaxID=655827 RepID=E9E8H0_METAQ|nr:DAD family protein [Metarhizium acridum CQMa 102]EFY87801.1 DAD family protein [Metarhizium acridum CQMa 102]
MAPKKNVRDRVATPSPAAPVQEASAAPAVSSLPAKTTPKGGRANWDEVLLNIYQYYMKETPQRTKLIDVFLLFLIAVGGLQFVYCVLAGNYVRFFIPSDRDRYGTCVLTFEGSRLMLFSQASVLRLVSLF